MTTVFYTWAYGRFMEIQSNLKRKKLHRTNSIIGRSWSPAKLFIVKNYTENANRDVLLTV